MKLLSILFSVFLLLSACPPDFVRLNDGPKCVKFITDLMARQGAEENCQKLGGSLLSIKNAIDNRAVLSMAINAGTSSVWIGTYCRQTANGTSCYYNDISGATTYSNFVSGFPKVDGYYGPCVFMASNQQGGGRWMSANCENYAIMSICEAL